MTLTEQHPQNTIAEDGPEIIRFDKAALKEHFGDFVRGTVEETLNALLDAEADELRVELIHHQPANRIQSVQTTLRCVLRLPPTDSQIRVPRHSILALNQCHPILSQHPSTIV